MNKSVKPGEKVDLRISGESAIVPNVVGEQLEAAQSMLIFAGFVMGDITETDSTRPSGEVLTQSLEGETRALMGAKVNITVSRSAPVMYQAQTKISITAPAGGVEILCTLVESTGEREVYRAAVSEGEQSISLDIETQEKGPHLVRLYLNGELETETQIDFTEEF